jgi:hypothetical protein
MNGIALFSQHVPETIHRLTKNIEHTAEHFAPHRHGDGSTQVFCFHSADHAFGRLHGDRSHAPFTQVLLHFGDDFRRLRAVGSRDHDAHGVVNLRQVMLLEHDVHHGTDHLHYVSDIFFLCHDLLPLSNLWVAAFCDSESRNAA